MCKDITCMCYDDHGECAARIAKLEAQLAAMTDERDSESRWAKHYSDKVTELEAQLAAAQERERVYRDVDALLEQPLEADHA